MSKSGSAIQKRKQEAEQIVRKVWGKNYSKVLASPTTKKLYYKLLALVVYSAQKGEIQLSKRDREKFVNELLDQANKAADKAREDYIFTLTRRAKYSKWGATAINSWLFEQRQQRILKKLADKSLKKNQAQTTSPSTKLSSSKGASVAKEKPSVKVSTNTNLRDSANDNS